MKYFDANKIIRWNVREIVTKAASVLRHENSLSDTPIRCTINDIMDSLEKTGDKVPHHYNQPRACKAVRREIMEWRRLEI